MKFFNTAGIINPEKHYFLAHRFHDDCLMKLIEQEKYFILHAPRQSGKTSAILEYVREINKQGLYQALYINVEAAQAARSNVIEGLRTIVSRFGSGIRLYCGPGHPVIDFIQKQLVSGQFSGNALYEMLQFLSENTPKPILLFIDEIDSLVGDTLISVLRQLRDGYAQRPHAFPQSVCLIGVRDVRDYRIWSDKEGATILGGSAFNIKAESLTLENFSQQQVCDLYLQHTHETGQIFTPEALQYAFYLTQGQPWLVNALAYQACFRDIIDRSQPITKEVIERSKEALIKRRDTHLDILIDRLEEPRVRAIIDAIVSGGGEEENFKIDDIQYVRDLGLIGSKGLVIANPIYQEIIPRELAYTKQETLVQETAWYVKPDGLLDIHKLLLAFTQFYRENSEIWLERFNYKEAGPHILLMAFLQRVINGGGTIHREYALGRKRVDLLICWKDQRIVIELKVLRNSSTKPDGLAQTAQYMDANNATEGHLVIFDRSSKSWDEKVYASQGRCDGKVISVWGL